MTRQLLDHGTVDIAVSKRKTTWYQRNKKNLDSKIFKKQITRHKEAETPFSGFIVAEAISTSFC